MKMMCIAEMQTEEGPCQNTQNSHIVLSFLINHWVDDVCKAYKRVNVFLKRKRRGSYCHGNITLNIPDLLRRQHQSISYCVSFLMRITGAKFQLQCLQISISFCDLSLHCNHLWGHHLNISRTREDVKKTAFFVILKCLSNKPNLVFSF